MDSAKCPYDQRWALFGGRVESETSVNEALNKELMARWNFSVETVEK
jgi:ADP-ribose pyrophosphatase YjhB (NUDIX family)